MKFKSGIYSIFNDIEEIPVPAPEQANENKTNHKKKYYYYLICRTRFNKSNKDYKNLIIK